MLVSSINSAVWGVPLLVAFTGTGLLLSVRSGFFQITHVGTWMKTTLGSIFSKKSRESGKGSISQTQALSAALAACMGTGNIVGVAAAIASGGAGAVFWMVISAIIGMMSACCENILGIKYRYRDENGEWMGGAFVYMERGLGFRQMAKIFCVLLVIASLGIGNMTQANAAALSLSGSFGLSPAITGLILAAGVFAITCGGLKRIASAAEKIIPAMTAIFILASFAVIIKNFRAVPSAFSRIISEAFSLRAAAGGAAGYGIKKALRYGVARGVFSNEAGLGSNAIIHAAAETDSPAEQGCWGILEVFLDTVVMCTVTAITLLVSGAPTDGDGSLACAAAFGSVFGKAGSIFCLREYLHFCLCNAHRLVILRAARARISAGRQEREDIQHNLRRGSIRRVRRRPRARMGALRPRERAHGGAESHLALPAQRRSDKRAEKDIS